MRFHPLTIGSSVVLLFGSICIVIALTTTYWNYYHAQYTVNGVVRPLGTSKGHRGLYYICHDSNAEIFQGAQTCLSRFKSYQMDMTSVNANPMMGGLSGLGNSYYQFYPLQGWEYACLIMLSMSAILGLAALLLAPLCCHNCLCGLIHSVFVYLAALFALLGFGVYMGYQLNSSMSQTSQSMKFDSFGWSFIVCIIGVIFQFIAAVMYTIAACCCHANEGYERGNRV